MYSGMQTKTALPARLRREWKTLLLSVLLFALAAAWLSPLVYSFFASFKTNVEMKRFSKYLNVLPLQWTTDNYAFVWNNTAAPFVSMVMNSFIVSGVTVLLVLFISSTSAYAYERLQFRGKEKLFWFLFGLSMIPGVVALVPQYYLYDALGWTNRLICLITPALGNVFNIFLLRNFMHGIPKDMDESARIDGASDLHIYLRIILPCLYPAMMVVALFTFTASWNDLMWPSLAITTPSRLTLTAGIRLLNDSYGGYYERVLAACMLAVIPTFLLYLFARRYFMQGLQLSAAVKG